MSNYYYGIDSEMDKKIDHAIDRYIEATWKQKECSVCGSNKVEVKEDSETCEMFCRPCLVEALREDIDGLVDTGFLE